MNSKTKQKNQSNNSTIAKNIGTGLLGLGALVGTATSQTPEQIRQVQQAHENLPKLEQIKKIQQWLDVKQVDSLEMLLGNNRLYDLSNATVQTEPTTGIGSVFEENGELLVNLSMTGDQEYRFQNERDFQKYVTVTFPSMINYLRLNDDEAKRMFSRYSGARIQDIKIERDENNQAINIYGLPSEITTTRRLRDGRTVTHDRWMPSTQLNENSQVSHIAAFPLDKVISAMFDYDPRIVQELNRKDITHQEAMDNIQTYLDDCKEQNEFLKQVKDSLETKTDSLITQADSTRQALDSVQDIVRRWEVLIKGGVRAYNQNTDNTSQLIFTPELGLYATWGGKTGTGLIYTFPVTKQLFSGQETERSEPPTPNRPVMVRQTTTNEYLKENLAELMLGYRTGNFVPFITGGINWGQLTTEKQDYFWTERPGPNNTIHILDEQKDDVKTITKDFLEPVIGAGVRYQSPNNILGGYIRGATNAKFNKPYVSGGLSININNLKNLRRTQDRNNNGNGNGNNYGGNGR